LTTILLMLTMRAYEDTKIFLARIPAGTLLRAPLETGTSADVCSFAVVSYDIVRGPLRAALLPGGGITLAVRVVLRTLVVTVICSYST